MDVAERHRGLRAAYKEAEDAIHSLGIQGEGVDILAINELRYAGYHLLKSLTAAEDSERDEELRSAESYGERSLYEAHDAAIFFRLDLYQKFTEDYSTVVVSEVVENFVEIVKTMKRAKRLLEEARAATTDRSQYYSNIREIYGEIVDASETMEAARDELNKRLVEAHGGRLMAAANGYRSCRGGWRGAEWHTHHVGSLPCSNFRERRPRPMKETKSATLSRISGERAISETALRMSRGFRRHCPQNWHDTSPFGWSQLRDPTSRRRRRHSPLLPQLSYYRLSRFHDR